MRMSTVEELTFTRETLGRTPSTVMGMRLAHSSRIGNVVALSTMPPREGVETNLTPVAAVRESWVLAGQGDLGCGGGTRGCY